MELDFLTAVKLLRPADPKEKGHGVPPAFYSLLDQNKKAFAEATGPEQEEVLARHKGSTNDAYILKRLRAKEIRHCQVFTDDDEEYIRDVIRLLADGALPKPTTKKIAEALKKEAHPLRVVGILRRDISPLFFQATRAQMTQHAFNPREVILSSWLTAEDAKGRHE